MDTLKDFFDSLKERFTNPLVFSFAVSWTLINYKIPVALIFYKQSDLRIDGYKSFLDLINRNQDTCHMIVLPAILAIAYTILSTLIREGIRWYYAYVESSVDTNIHLVTKAHTVTVERYMEAATNYKSIIEKYQILIADQTGLRTLNEELTVKNQKMEIDKQQLDTDKNILKHQLEVLAASENTAKEEIVKLKQEIEDLKKRQS